MLPLAAVIMNSICTTHGGLFCSAEFVPEEKNRQISLGSLEELDHLNRELVGEGEGNPVNFIDILLSHPWMGNWSHENFLRGAGLFWGPDSNETSLKKSDLKVRLEISLLCLVNNWCC